MKADELEALLRSGNLSFLESLEPARAPEALSLGPGAAWVLGRHARRRGWEELALAFWRAELAEGSGPARLEAGRDLRALLRARSEWDGLLAASQAALAFSKGEAAASLDALDSLLRLGRNAEAAAFLAGMDPVLLSGSEALSQRSVALSLVSRSRAGRPMDDLEAFLGRVTDAEAIRILRAEFVDPLLAAEALDAVGLAMAELAGLPAGAEAVKNAAAGTASIDAASLALLKARALSAERSYAPARAAWSASGFPGSSHPLTETLVLEAGKAWLWGGGAAEGAALFAALARDEGRSAPLRAAAWLYAGRCLLASGKKEQARSALRSSIAAAAPDPAGVRDAAAWFLLDSLVENGGTAALDAFEETAPLWSDPSYFSDVLGRCTSNLVRAHDARGIERLHAAAKGRAEPELVDRLAWILSRMDPSASHPAPSPALRVGTAGAIPYHALLSELGRGGGELAQALSVSGAGPSPGSDPAAGSLEGFLALLIRSGLSGDALSIAQRSIKAAAEDPSAGQALDAPALRRLAARASLYGAHSQAALFCALATSADGMVTRADLEILYPRPYADELRTAAKERGLPEEILFALARTESWFNPAAVSSAGAVGLCQLMPATADGLAKKLRMESYDLRDAATSARMGATYLASLVDYFDGDLALAILAYNGGMGRIRSLRRESPELPTELFLESLPISETRDYGRRVIAAAAAYGWIWGDPDAASRLHGAFPGLIPEAEAGR